MSAVNIMSETLNQCVQYFKENKGYKRIFIELRKKWKIYGKPSGYVIIENATPQEQEAIKLFMGKNCGMPNMKFKVSEFEVALQETKFKGIGLSQLLEAYFSESMETNKNYRLEKADQKQKFFDQIINQMQEELVLWLQAALAEKKHGYGLLSAEYERSAQELKSAIVHVSRAMAKLKSLEQKKIRLAVLGAEVTANPHYFDRNTLAGKLLIYALRFAHGVPESQNAEEILALYYLSGIQPDDLSSHTVLYGINLYTEKGAHQAYDAFIYGEEPYLVSLSNLSKICQADCKSKKVFVLENQMVFSDLCERAAGLQVSMMCTAGQLRTASLLLLDLLCLSGCTIYYSGDIDPEGLGIADRVISRHPDQIFPWRITKEDYERCISNEALDDTRLKKLDGIRDKRLKEVAEALGKEKRAGYQELLLERLFDDMKKACALT